MTLSRFKQRLPHVVRLAAVTSLALAITGCATSYPESTGAGSTNLANLTGAASLPADVSSFLDSAAPGSVIAVPTSPWGSNVEVVAHERYFAASGRICRELTVSNQRDLPGKELACRTSNDGKAGEGTWVTQRLVTGLLEEAR
ncbi:DVU3141 family protein [Cobetia amphilecti]|uniref:DVU3141 family protein n=1 Tax=Cobetia amphilecti TaxID=1055104 RepID=UPI0012EBA09C|nr:DVU3141 family protein [Cobetia amphilecti]